MSLGGVESTIFAPSLTSHRHLTSEQKKKDGISDSLLRLSVGIEDANDLILDLELAMK
jgi:cystathionine beta-lyase